MSMFARIRAWLPAPAKRVLRPLFDLSQRGKSKYQAELSFWDQRYATEGGRFQNHWYRDNMLAMAGEKDERFLNGRIVADFGCGPRGSLTWAGSAALRIGIDVLAHRYLEHFGACLVTHNMLYVTCTEKFIPLPSGLIDVMYTVNALDHVDDFELMTHEILRVMRPGGQLIGSFNLGEPVTKTEPQTLSEARIREALLDRLEIDSYRLGRQGPSETPYSHLMQNDPTYHQGEAGFLWVRARKPASRGTGME